MDNWLSTTPAELDKTNPTSPIHQRKYAHVIDTLPAAENTEQTDVRVLAFWSDNIVPAIKQGKIALVVGHRGSIAAIAK